MVPYLLLAIFFVFKSQALLDFGNYEMENYGMQAHLKIPSIEFIHKLSNLYFLLIKSLRTR
jgi:hypothetical protein